MPMDNQFAAQAGEGPRRTTFKNCAALVSLEDELANWYY
jgi:hypothetical protein